MRLLASLAVLLFAGCGGPSRPAATVPDLGPEQAVNQFMRAVADSNLGAMARHWGTEAGPAAVTGQPTDYQRRIQVMQLILRGSSTRVQQTLESDRDRAVLLVELLRDGCRRQVTFTTVRTRGGTWLVNNLDLPAAGTPGRPCPTEDRQPPG